MPLDRLRPFLCFGLSLCSARPISPVATLAAVNDLVDYSGQALSTALAATLVDPLAPRGRRQ